MERGFVFTAGFTGIHQQWIEGDPEWSPMWGVRREGKKTAGPVAAFRCSRRGYLESYAVESPSPPPFRRR